MNADEINKAFQKEHGSLLVAVYAGFTQTVPGSPTVWQEKLEKFKADYDLKNFDVLSEWDTISEGFTRIGFFWNFYGQDE